MRVQHNRWFDLTVNGIEYRAVYISRGWTYAALEIQEKIVYEEPKYWFFGEIVTKERWITITYDHREDFPTIGNVINRAKSYDAAKTRQIIENVIRCQNNSKHTERI